MSDNQEAFSIFLRNLEPDLTGSEKRYNQLRQKLVKYFSWKYCDDPEGYADETISRITKNILGGEEIRASNPYIYVYAVAKYVFMEYLRKKKKDQEFAQFPPDDLIETPPDDRRDCRIICLEALATDKLKLLREYYSDEDARERLAQSLGVTINALRLQIHRIKNDLRECYLKCLKQRK